MIIDKVTYKPIGIIHSPFKQTEGSPIQPTSKAAIDSYGEVEVFSQYQEGLKDLDGFSHIILLYHLHLSKSPSLMVKPYMDNQKRGVFATRAPSRPNSIGLSIVKIVKIVANKISIKELDIVDNSPLLDIKPYVPKFDLRQTDNVGWLKENISKLSDIYDDGRFTK